jgi:sorbitol-specific phosphotransferase system component IIBC
VEEIDPNMAIDISGIFFFMPVFSFLFVFMIVWSILVKTKLLGDAPFVNLFISLIMAVIFMSFSSLDLYVRTIIPWFIALFVCVFLVLLLGGLATKDVTKLMTNNFGWVTIVLLLIIFLISAIKVFNPVFHPDLIITSGEGTSLIEQIRYGADGTIFGTILLIIIAGVVSWVLVKK